jgi:hypothetical protein
MSLVVVDLPGDGDGGGNDGDNGGGDVDAEGLTSLRTESMPAVWHHPSRGPTGHLVIR